VQITCEKCQTSYQVDDQLIPPEGAPVQCTKCGNLFTAYPQAQPARAPARTVMMFAADPVQAAPPPAGAAVPRAPTQPAPVAPARTQGFPAAPAPVSRAPSGQHPAAPGPFASAPTQAFGVPSTPGPLPNPYPPAATPGSVSPSQPAAVPRVPSSTAVPVPAAAPGPAQAGPSALDQPLDLSRPGRMTQMFYNQGEEAEEANLRASRAAVGEANRKPGQSGLFMQAADLEKQLRRRNRAALWLVLVLAAAALLGVLGSMFLPALLGPPGADAQAVRDEAAAVALARKDDIPDLQTADKALAEVIARKPLYVAARADRAMVQQFLSDDRTWQAERLKASYDALVKQVKQINNKNDPADAPQRAKDMDAMAVMNKQYEALGKQARDFEAQAKALADEAAKAEPKNPAVLRARAFISADHDMAEPAQKLMKQYLHELGKPHDAWSELALAEIDVNGKASEEKRLDGLDHARAALALDPGMVRALYLKVRLDAMNKKEAEARDDASALAAANPAHTGGASQVAGLEEQLVREKLDKEARDARIAAEAKAQAAAAAEAEQDKKAPKAKAAAKHNR